jgi:uncharacterized membrane protein
MDNDQYSHADTHLRTFLKAFSYRFLVVIVDTIVLLSITGESNMVIAIVGIGNISATIIYILHERIWNEIKWYRASHFHIEHKSPTIKEKIERSLLKAITYRSFILLADLIILNSYLNTLKYSLMIVLLSNFIRTILYFIHERVWLRIPWGIVLRKMTINESNL